MEIIKISTTLLLFFYLTWLQLFYLMIFSSLYYYYKNNTLYLIENPSFTNNLVYGFIMVLQFISETIKRSWNFSKKIKYINLVPTYIENLNDKYLYYKKKATLFILMHSAKYVFRFIGNKNNNVVKVKKNRQLKSSEDINMFLDKLQKNRSETERKRDLDDFVEKIIKNE